MRACVRTRIRASARALAGVRACDLSYYLFIVTSRVER